MNRNEPVHTVRDVTSKNAVLERLALAHDRFSEAEQLYLAEGQIAMASGSHTYALICLRAYRAELDDPEPRC